MRHIYQGILLLSITIGITGLAHSQTRKTPQILKGQIFDSKSAEPIPFAHIISLTNLQGTTSGMNGVFELPSATAIDQDSLRISCIGYETLTIPFPDTTILRVELVPKRYEMNEVTVTPSSEWEHDHLGTRLYNPFHGNFASGSISNSNLSSYYIKKKWDGTLPFRINKARVHINNMFNNDSLLLRVRFLAVDSETGLPGSALISQNLTTIFTKERGWVNFNFNEMEHPIWLEEREFYVVIDCVKSPGTDQPIMPMFSCNTLPNQVMLLDPNGYRTHSPILMHTLFISYLE